MRRNLLKAWKDPGLCLDQERIDWFRRPEKKKQRLANRLASSQLTVTVKKVAVTEKPPHGVNPVYQVPGTFNENVQVFKERIQKR